MFETEVVAVLRVRGSCVEKVPQADFLSKASCAELAPAQSLGPHLSLWLPAMKEDLKVEDGKLAKRINYSFTD